VSGSEVAEVQHGKSKTGIGRPKRVAWRTSGRNCIVIRIDLRVELNYEVDSPGADFIFNIQAARTPRQTIVAEGLMLNQPVAQRMHTDQASGNRYLYVHALPGELKLVYSATVDLAHHFAEPAEIAEVPVCNLPPEAIGYIYPSRYCQSDLLTKLATGEFGNLRQGYGRVQAIRDWVQSCVKFTSNSSNSNTSAIETLAQHVGVCRDFAHLMIALCRAVNIPARFASGTDYGADPALGLPDFQAYVEVFLGDRWYIFDPSGTAIPMGFVRFGTGRDAADVSFATIFGSVRSQAPVIRAVAVNDPARGMVLPYLCPVALSTDGVRDEPLSREPESSPGNTGGSNTR
jgi:transglutaminase-like putative cysteine protease